MRRPPPPQHLQLRRRQLLVWPAAWALAAAGSGARADESPGIEVLGLRLLRTEAGLQLDFWPRIQVSRTVQDALERGVPVYFLAQATLLRYRWYWRDERLGRLQRSWRLAFQPLTSTWRVGTGGLSQAFASLPEALAAIQLSGWKVAEAAQLAADQRYRVDFSFQLDTSQLPGPMQIGLTAQGDWILGVERIVDVE